VEIQEKIERTIKVKWQQHERVKVKKTRVQVARIEGFRTTS